MRSCECCGQKLKPTPPKCFICGDHHVVVVLQTRGQATSKHLCHEHYKDLNFILWRWQKKRGINLWELVDGLGVQEAKRKIKEVEKELEKGAST